jgi:branched-chain amino acid transport system substrate-binding protein
MSMKRRDFLSAIPVIGSGVLATSYLSQAFAQKGDGEDSPLLVGCTAAMTGPLGGFGIEMKLGVDAAVKQINAKGGINGRPLKYEVLDDGYVPDRAVENARKLIASPKVVALMGCLGTPTNAAITPLIEAAGLPHLAPLTGASSLRKAELKNVFHLRASYTDEITRLVHNLVSMGIRDLAIVYLDNPYGKELAEDAKRALASSGIVNPTLVPLAVDGKTMAQTVSATLAAKSSAVLLCTAGAATTGLVAQLKKASPSLPIAGVSASFTQDGIKTLGTAAQGIGVTIVYPEANLSKHLIVRDYQSAMRGIDQSFFSNGSLEGYISMRTMADALQRAGRTISRDKVRQALASIRNLDLGGFTVDYGSSGARVGSKYVELAVMTGDGRLKV